jgi:TolB protein
LGQAFLVGAGDAPVFEKTVTVAGDGVRTGAHRLADVLIGALTGHNGGFASRLTFAAGQEKVRRVHVIDADGHGAKAISRDDETPVSPAFGEDGELHYAASKDNGLYRVVSEGGQEHPLAMKGSVYGLAFSKDRAKVAVSVGSGPFIRLFAGPDLDHLTQASSAPFAMEPTFTPTGKLAFVGLGTTGQRIFVDDKPVTPDGIFAMSPTFCNHPDGIRLVFAAGPGTHTDLFAAGETGGSLVRLTQDQGKNSSPACSPDGRLVAFFSTRTTGEGPGLYVMRVDGLRPKRISPLLGDSLRWDALPK